MSASRIHPLVAAALGLAMICLPSPSFAQGGALRADIVGSWQCSVVDPENPDIVIRRLATFSIGRTLKSVTSGLSSQGAWRPDGARSFESVEAAATSTAVALRVEIRSSYQIVDADTLSTRFEIEIATATDPPRTGEASGSCTRIRASAPIAARPLIGLLPLPGLVGTWSCAVAEDPRLPSFIASFDLTGGVTSSDVTPTFVGAGLGHGAWARAGLFEHTSREIVAQGLELLAFTTTFRSTLGGTLSFSRTGSFTPGAPEETRTGTCHRVTVTAE